MTDTIASLEIFAALSLLLCGITAIAIVLTRARDDSTRTEGE